MKNLSENNPPQATYSGDAIGGFYGPGSSLSLFVFMAKKSPWGLQAQGITGQAAYGINRIQTKRSN